MENTFEKFRANERIIEVVRPGIIANVVPAWIWVFFIGGITAATATLLFFLPWPLFARTSVGVSVAVLLLLLIRSLLKIYKDSLVLTNRRLIESKRQGFFHMSRTEWHYDQIYRVRFAIKGLIGKLLNSGYLKIEPLGGNESLIIGPILSPARMQNLILELQQEYIKHTRMGSNPLHAQRYGEVDEREAVFRPSLGELIELIRKIMEAENTQRALNKGDGREIKIQK